MTTVAKAKEAARCAEKVITLGKRGTPSSLASAQSFLFAPRETLPALSQLATRYADRPGGYTRVHLFGHRKSDHAPRAILELVDNPSDVKLEMTARAMARETHVMLHRAQKHISMSALGQLLEAQKDVPLEHDTRFEPLTRRNIAKVVRFGGDAAREQLVQRATAHLERLRAHEEVEGPRRADQELWDAMELQRPSRGRIITHPMRGQRTIAGQLTAEEHARVGTESVVEQPIRRRDGSVAPRRTVVARKPSVVRLGKGAFARRYVRGSSTPTP